MSDPRIEKIRKDYGLGERDVWELPQKRGTWLILHRACEDIAAQAGITFEMPTILEADSGNGLASLIVRGFRGDQSAWAVGECSPKNNRNAYPWAMAEKRGKDRVILKLVGIHGLVYSEDEIKEDDEGIPQTQYPEPPRRPSGKPQAGWREDGSRTPHSLRQTLVWSAEFERELNEVDNPVKMKKFIDDWAKKIETDRWGEDWKTVARDAIRAHKAKLAQPVDDADVFPGDRP